jgi:hypothetical protein
MHFEVYARVPFEDERVSLRRPFILIVAFSADIDVRDGGDVGDGGPETDLCALLHLSTYLEWDVPPNDLKTMREGVRTAFSSLRFLPRGLQQR